MMTIKMAKKSADAVSKLIKVALVSACFMVSGFAQAGDIEAGEAASATCAACHGADGNSTIPTNPKLAGQYESYLKQALKDYRSGVRKNAIMSGFASALTDKQINDLAAYFAAQESTLQTVVER